MRINTNLSALNAYRLITSTDNNLKKVLERLSSGIKINRASDDAAGLGISEKIRGQIIGIQMAVKNTQDAISLLQTAEGALSEVHSILHRMRELAVQAANDTNTEVDRAAIEREIDQLRMEIDRISRSTEFNTRKLLDGSIEPFRAFPHYFVSVPGGINVLATLNGSFDLAGIIGHYGEVNERDGAQQVELVYSGVKLGAVSISVSGKTVYVYSNGYKVLSFDVPDEVDRYYVSVFKGGLRFNFLVSDVAPNPLVSFASTLSVPTVVRLSTVYHIPATVTTRLTLTTTITLSTSITSPTYTTFPTVINYSTTLVIPFSYSTTLITQVGSHIPSVFNINRTFTKPTTIIVPLRIPGETMSVSTTLVVNKTVTLSGVFFGKSTITPPFNVSTTNIYLPANLEFTIPSPTSIPTTLTLSTTVTFSTLLSFSKWLLGPVSFAVPTTLVTTTVCTTRLSLVKAQINSFEVSVATTVPIRFEDVFEGSYIVEVGQFKGNADSPLDAKLSYFDKHGLKTSTIVDFSLGGVLHGEISTGSRILYNGSNFDINVIGRKGIVINWDKNSYSISDFNGALPKNEVIDAGAVRTDERYHKSKHLVFQIGPNQGNNIRFGIDKVDSGALGLSSEALNFSTQDSSERSITVVDNAIQKVSSIRANIGAIQNRLEHTIFNLQNTAENLTAAESRIRDADMAKEMMAFTKQQILMQSGMSMLAQANGLPQNVLQLLRG